MRVGALLLAALLLAPTAAAWTAQVRQDVAPGLRLRDGLLLGGAVDARANGTAALGAADASGLFVGEGATITACPAQEGASGPTCGGRPDAPNAHARLRVLSGGVVVWPLNPSPALLATPAGAALLGRADLRNLSQPLDVAGPAIAVGGGARAHADGSDFLVRPFGRNVSLEVRGDAGIRRYNGTQHVFAVSNASGLDLEADAAFLVLGNGSEVRVARAPLARAEASTGLDDLYALLRAMSPPGDADRRADLAVAFGPFQVVPALLDGAIAARANLTLNGERQDRFVLLRAPDAAFRLDNGSWAGTGAATLFVQDDVLAPDPGSRVDPPIVLPLVLALLALAARALTPRERTAWSRRRKVAAVRALGLALLVMLAAWTLAPLLGFHPLFDLGPLALRSRFQVALLTVGLGLAAWVAVGLSLESLARSALALRRRPAARFVPVLVGLAGAALFLWLAAPALTSLVARFVRL